MAARYAGVNAARRSAQRSRSARRSTTAAGLDARGAVGSRAGVASARSSESGAGPRAARRPTRLRQRFRTIVASHPRSRSSAMRCGSYPDSARYARTRASCVASSASWASPRTRRAMVYRRSWWAITRRSNAPSRSRASWAVRRSSSSITSLNHHDAASVASANGSPAGLVGAPGACDNPAQMGHVDRFDDLIESLAGFHRTWLVYLGLELGLFAALRTAGPDGLEPAELAEATESHPRPVEAWAWAADAHDLATLEDGRLRVDPDVATIVLDDDHRDYLGGQFVHAVVASMDWSGMVDFFRTGRPIADRPDRYRLAIERLTRQDIGVFFQVALAALPQLVAELSAGGRVVDIHCGGGRWLVAMARRFPRLELVGVEFEADSVARARATVESEGLADRITIREAKATDPGATSAFDLAYFQYALHQLPDTQGVLRAAWQALRPGGRLVVLDWPLPTSSDEFRTRHGELIAGIQLDELLQG